MTVGIDSPAPCRIGVAIIGAQKCGTTTLAALLDEHPEISLGIGKESHLFDQAHVQRSGPSDDAVARYWADAPPGSLLLDATPSYLYLPGCVEALLRHSPDVALIVVLRSPGDRMLSHHGHECRLGVERWPPLIAFLLERRRLRRSPDPLAADSAHRHASYRDRSRYSRQLEHLASLTDRYHIVLLDDLVADPDRVVAGIHRFLGLTALPVRHLPRLNAGDGRKRRFVRGVVRLMMRREAIATERMLGLPAGALR